MNSPEKTAVPQGRHVSVVNEKAALKNAESRVAIAEAGFMPLFNGKNLDGWGFPYEDTDKEGWSVVNGVLQGRSLKGHGLSHIATSRTDYRNFHLRMVLMTDHKNKHIIFRSNSVGLQSKNYRLNWVARLGMASLQKRWVGFS